MTSIDILILAGKRPRPGTVLAEVQAQLERNGLCVSVDWHEHRSTLETARPSLLVHRGLTPATMVQLQQTMALGSQDTVVINSLAASLLALDRKRGLDTLKEAGVSVPESSVHTDWADVRRRAQRGPVYVKALSGSTGRGAGVVSLAQDSLASPPFPGPWHVEVALVRDGIDRKLYVVGSRVFGLLKPWPRDDSPAQAFEPSAAMAELALTTGRATGLELFGVDLVGSEGTFAVVDVNPFPGYRGVDGAAAAAADHIAARVAAT